VPLTIREELLSDIVAIRAVNDSAFGQPQEGRLVDLLRDNDAISLSLVAVSDDRVIGHVLYSPVSIDAGDRAIVGVGLGPVSVQPEFQRIGVGRRLIEAGIAEFERQGVPYMVVLGHPQYYPRFGFEPASRWSIRCEWEVPDPAFMIRVFDPQRLATVTGVVRYRPEFAAVG